MSHPGGNVTTEWHLLVVPLNKRWGGKYFPVAVAAKTAIISYLSSLPTTGTILSPARFISPFTRGNNLEPSLIPVDNKINWDII